MSEERKRGAISVRPSDRPSERVDLYDRLWAVVVGIDTYPNLGEAYQLERAVRDAGAVARVLREGYGFDEVMELYDADATEDRLNDVLKGTLRQTGQDDAVLVYFAGHGYTEETALAGHRQSDSLRRGSDAAVGGALPPEIPRPVRNEQDHRVLHRSGPYRSGIRTSGRT